MTKITRKELSERKDLEPLLQSRDQYHKIKVLHETEGGKELVTLLVEEVVSIVNRLSQSDASPLCADLKANLNLLRLIQNAEENEGVVEESLKEALLE